MTSSLSAIERARLPPKDIFVIGGSAGSIEALRAIVFGLPGNFPGSIFVVVHVAPNSPGLLSRLLSNSGALRATNPVDQERFHGGHLYVARPDHHLTIEDGRVRMLRGPRENRHRPAIDALFRSAAREYGPRVVGILLSGLQDDGSSGLYAIKQRGGIAIVQDPGDATWKDMPKRAIEYAKPQFILPHREIATLLVDLATKDGKSVMGTKKGSVTRKINRRKQKRNLSVPEDIQPSDVNEEAAYAEEGDGIPSVFACPECHGVLWELRDNEMVRFRCRIGHSYGPESLGRELSLASENALWAAVRALEEKAALQRRVAEGMGDRSMSSRLLEQSSADVANARLIREMIFNGDAKLEPDEFAPLKKPA